MGSRPLKRRADYSDPVESGPSDRPARMWKKRHVEETSSRGLPREVQLARIQTSLDNLVEEARVAREDRHAIKDSIQDIQALVEEMTRRV